MMERVKSCPSILTLGSCADEASSLNTAFNWIKDGSYLLFDKSGNLGDIIGFDWYANEALTRDFLDCMVNLVSYNGCYIAPCFEILVKIFLPKKIEKKSGAVYDMDTTNKLAELAHATLHKIISLVPLSTTCLYGVLKDNFPHKRLDAEVQYAYLRNMLVVTQYCPSLIDPLLSLAIDRLIQLDVDIKLEDIPDYEDEQLQFDVEMDNHGSQTIANEAQVLADKLDAMMHLMFEYLDSMFGQKSSSNNNDLFNIRELKRPEELFHMLLRIFDDFILNTYKSKYTQFLLFYVCRLKRNNGSKSPFAEPFLAYLLNKLVDNTVHSTVRLACAGYLGSFVARASFLPPQMVLDSFTVLMDWALRYLNTAGDNVVVDAKVHGIFYMVSQAIYYIFCFRHRIIASAPPPSAGNFAQGLKRITESKLNPFKLCLPTVVREFCRIVTRLKWFSPEEILIRNERIVLASSSSFGGPNQLESFFPFDPYLLKNSSSFIKDLYNVWTETADGEDEESGDENEQDIAEEGESDEIEDTNSNEETMSFTPDIEQDLRFHFSFDE